MTSEIKFYGALNHIEVLKFMSQCDIFIMPSKNEALGVVYLEAMSFKKPVIGSFNEGICDFIKDGINGFLVDPDDVNGIVEKLRLLIEDANLRFEIGKKGYETIKDLTWESNAEQNLHLYKNILKLL